MLNLLVPSLSLLLQQQQRRRRRRETGGGGAPFPFPFSLSSLHISHLMLLPLVCSPSTFHLPPSTKFNSSEEKRSLRQDQLTLPWTGVAGLQESSSLNELPYQTLPTLTSFSCPPTKSMNQQAQDKRESRVETSRPPSRPSVRLV